jgi:hypothetical protein
VQEFYNLFVNDPKATPEMQSIRKTQMQTNYQKAIDAANKNVYGVRLDAADLTNKMQVRGILGRLSDRMVEMVGSPNLLRLTNPIAGDLSNTIRKEIPKLF